MKHAGAEPIYALDLPTGFSLDGARMPGLVEVKDARGIKMMTPQMQQSERQRSAVLVPVGQGEIDYKAIFAAADVAETRQPKTACFRLRWQFALRQLANQCPRRRTSQG